MIEGTHICTISERHQPHVWTLDNVVYFHCRGLGYIKKQDHDTFYRPSQSKGNK